MARIEGAVLGHVGSRIQAVLQLLEEELGLTLVLLPSMPHRHVGGRHVDIPLVRDGVEWAVLRAIGPDAERRFAAATARRLAARLLLDAIATDSGEPQARETTRAVICELLEEEAMEVVLQPIVELASAQIVGVEALSRFPSHPNRTPEAWFALAAAAGLGNRLETVAVQRAVKVLEYLPEGVYLSVNVSPRVLMSSALDATLREVPVDRMVLEITEHAQVADYTALAEVLQPWRARGARVAVDDTGSGFASMRHVLRLEPEIVKLDCSLTHDIDNDAVLRALGYTLKAFASAIGAETVAEGIETERELYALRFLGVPYGQGFLFQSPLQLDPATWPQQFPFSASMTA